MLGVKDPADKSGKRPAVVDLISKETNEIITHCDYYNEGVVREGDR